MKNTDSQLTNWLIRSSNFAQSIQEDNYIATLPYQEDLRYLKDSNKDYSVEWRKE